MFEGEVKKGPAVGGCLRVRWKRTCSWAGGGGGEAVFEDEVEKDLQLGVCLRVR